MIFGILTIILGVIFTSIFAQFFGRYFRKQDLRPISIEEIFVFLNRTYMNGLLKLVDLLEEAYERQTHTKGEFSEIQSWRIAKTREHFRRIVANADTLHRFAYRHLKGEDATKKFLARRVINYAVPVKMYGRTGIFVLFVCSRLLFLDGVVLHIELPILRHLVEGTLGAYEDLKEAALMFSRHSEPGTEVKLAARL